jgi:hypothetical protein
VNTALSLDLRQFFLLFLFSFVFTTPDHISLRTSLSLCHRRRRCLSSLPHVQSNDAVLISQILSMNVSGGLRHSHERRTRFLSSIVNLPSPSVEDVMTNRRLCDSPSIFLSWHRVDVLSNFARRTYSKQTCLCNLIHTEQTLLNNCLKTPLHPNSPSNDT